MDIFSPSSSRAEQNYTVFTHKSLAGLRATLAAPRDFVQFTQTPGHAEGESKSNVSKAISYLLSIVLVRHLNIV